ncbi:MAG: hypothetical protein KF687_05590 [Cyclobacteriaceae bacterium]|nr:hypothetical protein [Cyclobacteriaceae bacterium]MBX2961966.1 hypothetical protein [Cyclobacteriaceae bacterium]
MGARKIKLDECHVVALKDGVEIDIGDAQSGKKGYSCIGCGAEMQAVKFQDINHLSYFRHHPQGVDKPRLCTWTDTAYRHGVARQILLTTKFIKVPAVKIFPPKEIEGPAMVIKKAHTIRAHRAELGLYFFENELGLIQSASKEPTGNVHHVYRPDVVFYDSENTSILFIELVDTQKKENTNLADFKRLGIDVVRVSVPKNSRIAIEETFSKTHRTKWLYNNERERTKYISVSGGDSEDVHDFDGVQRGLYEENVTCWANQINGLIRSIKKCLGAKSYTSIEQRIRNEISRINDDLQSNRIRFGSRKEDIEREIREQYESQAKELGQQEDEFRKREIEQHSLIAEARELENRGWTRNKSDSERREELHFEVEKGRVESDIGRGKERINAVRKKRIGLSEESSLDQDPSIERLRNDKEEEEGSITKLLQNLEELPERFRGIRKETSTRFDRLRAETERRIVTRRDGFTSAIRTGDIERVAKFSNGTLELLEIKGQILDLAEKERACQRLYFALKSLRSGAYKAWVE